MSRTLDRLHARLNGPDAPWPTHIERLHYMGACQCRACIANRVWPAPAPAPAPKAKGGIPGWITWGIVVPLTLLCPPLFGPVLILCLVAGRD